MGIPGLTSYVDTLPFGEGKVWEAYDLRGTNLIIDGCGLYYHIYGSNQMNIKYGGQYDELCNRVKEFFTKLQLNNVVPYVVFDGIMNRDEKKFDTKVNRKKECIKRMKNLWTPSGSGYEMVIPNLAQMAVVQVLQEIKVPYAVADFEADCEIAVLANELNAPVMANDSDFFIFNVKHGYIPFQHYDFDGSNIRVRKFSFSGFAKYLGMDVEMSPLLASLMGNDYISSTMLTPFTAHIERLVSLSQLKAGSRKCRVPTIAQFLSKYESVSEAFDAVVSLFPQGPKSLFKKALRLSIQEYQRTKSNLIGYFNSGQLGSNMHTYNGEAVPQWLIKLYREGLFAPEALACLCNRKLFLRTQSEDISMPSAQICAQSLRWYCYALAMNCEVTSTVVTESQSKASIQSMVLGQTKLRRGYDSFNMRSLTSESMVKKGSICSDTAPLSSSNSRSKLIKDSVFPNTKTDFEFHHTHKGYAMEPRLPCKTYSPVRPTETDHTRLVINSHHTLSSELAPASQRKSDTLSGYYYIPAETPSTIMGSKANQYASETRPPRLPATRYSNIGTKFELLQIEDQMCDEPFGNGTKLVTDKDNKFTLPHEEMIVTELVREGSTLVPKKVNLRVEVPESQIKIHDIPKMSGNAKKNHVLSLLDCNLPFIHDLSIKHQLVVSALRYWFIHTRVKEAHLAALLVHYVGERRSSTSRISESIQVSVQAVHGFAQWQNVLYWVQRLNSLFSFMFPPLHVPKLYDGIRVCLLYQRLKVLGIKFAETIVSSTKVNLYCQLYDAVTKDLPRDSQFNQSRRREKRESRKSEEGKQMRSKNTESLKGNMFALLCGESDSDEDSKMHMYDLY